MAWKTLQDYFEFLGYEGVYGPRKVILRAAQDDYIAEGKKWLDMLEAFQRTTHTYNRQTAQAIFDAVRETYFELIQHLLLRLKEELPNAP